MTTQTTQAAPGHEVVVQGVDKRYGKTPALAGVDATIGAGRFVVLLGPSGSGKSTLARCLAGVERIDGGAIHMAGTLVGDGRRHLPPDRRNLAMVFQDYALWPHLSVAGNVSYALRRRKLPGAEVERRVADALERVGLGALKDRYPHELSGGEQQRVSLARAVVGRPGLLIFDEPLSNLDADLRERLRVEIATLTRETGATAVYITHDQSEAFALADEIIVLDRGSIVQAGAPEDIYHRPATPFVARFTGIAGELAGVVARADGDQVGVDVAGVRLSARAGDALAAGDRVRLLIRPAATSIHDPSSAPLGGLAGTVIDVAYRGRGYDHVVETAAGSLAAVFSPRRWDRSGTVSVAVDPAGCSAYRTEGPHPADSRVLDLTAVTLSA
ncbi:ABC transporter ATP-binding protein [Acidiferrimicrobium sp. IK]|uniref:ABC transporter ATP-binding protein n=1 Tax=Acidiferrimicrobium sp. IK TaxID=2871700 RepID=UPI0021CB7DDC|nr:ABC transporter ATP-binding protein [Acidiferrimicrobium sp. IK]MCU4185512.1 ABC transporter ATP-binding protein [Acidiferrimicrobium sp. IK]